MKELKMKTTLIFIAVLAAYALTNNAHASCDWNNPGSNRYTGNQSAALDNYKDIPQEIKNILKGKINAHQYDDQIEISRIGMVGKHNYNNGRDMHWGQNKMCKGEFSISKWNYMHTEAALVYTHNGYSIAIPSVCGNVFRLDLLAGGNKNTGGGSFIIPDNIPVQNQKEETPAEDVPFAGGSSKTETSVWPSGSGEVVVQNSIIPHRETEFMPVPPMPSIPVFIPSNPVPIPVIPAVPEPSTYAMLIVGALVVFSRKK